jgi:hypothetical protein
MRLVIVFWVWVLAIVAMGFNIFAGLGLFLIGARILDNAPKAA